MLGSGTVTSGNSGTGVGSIASVAWPPESVTLNRHVQPAASSSSLKNVRCIVWTSPPCSPGVSLATMSTNSLPTASAPLTNGSTARVPAQVEQELHLAGRLELDEELVDVGLECQRPDRAVPRDRPGELEDLLVRLGILCRRRDRRGGPRAATHAATMTARVMQAAWIETRQALQAAPKPARTPERRRCR